nr:hypothetical protein [Tanacetum cinerariifolium]
WADTTFLRVQRNVFENASLIRDVFAVVSTCHSWRPVMSRRLFQTGSDLPKGSARKARLEKKRRTKAQKASKE